jgi:hypothetical protein
MTEGVGSRIAITFASIHKLGMGQDYGKPCALHVFPGLHATTC